MKDISITHKSIRSITQSESILKEDSIIIEQGLQIDISYFQHGKLHRRNLAITMRTPGNDIELVKGFCLTENIIQNWQEIDSTEQEEENLIHIQLKESVVIDIYSSSRQVFGNSSCGICGKTSLDHICSESNYLPWSEKWTMSRNTVFSLYQKLEKLESIFKLTGGNHIAVLVNSNGEIERFYEDVGRHNAMDKLVGSSENLPLSNFLVMWSGRSSFELVQKAAKVGIPITLSMGAPSSLAIELAEEHGMTLVGFMKEKKFNIYTNPERII